MNETRNQIRLKIPGRISYQELSEIVTKLENFKDFNITVDETIYLKS